MPSTLRCRLLFILVPFGILAACGPIRIALPRALTTDVVEQGYVAIGESRRIAIAQGDAHTYRVRLAPDTFITLVAEQDNVDVHIRVRRPDGSPFGVFTTRERYFAPDVAYFIADEGGVWQFEIGIGADRPQPGAYTLTLEALRLATEDDRRLMAWHQDWAVQVGRLFNAANRGDWDTVIPSFYQWLDDTEKFPARDPKHNDVAVGAITLSREQWNRFQADEVAVAMVEAAISYVGRVRGQEDVLEAPIRAWLSGLYLIQDRSDDARREFETAQAILARQPGVEPIDQVVVSQAAGRYYLDRGPPGDAVLALETAYALLAEGLSPVPGTLNQAMYDLGSAYLYGNDAHRARAMLERATTDDAIRNLPPFDRVDRLTRTAHACLEAGDYDCVRSTTERALGISEDTTISVNRVSTVLITDTEALIGMGNYDVAAMVLERALENEAHRPPDQANRLLPSYRILTMLADVEIARGRYPEADRRYREAVRAAATVPDYRPFDAARAWGRLLRDVGRIDEAERLERWAQGDGEPLPEPGPGAPPERIGQVPGRYTILTRLEGPFRRNLSPLWDDLELERWDIPDGDCSTCQWESYDVDPNDVTAGILMRIIMRGDDRDVGAMRLFLFRPRDPAGTDGWEATDVLDFAENPGGRFGFEHTGLDNIVRVSVESGPGEFDFLFRRFSVVDGRFVPLEEE